MKKVIEKMNKTKTIELATALFTIGTASRSLESIALYKAVGQHSSVVISNHDVIDCKMLS